jgi:hypothetical protein
MAAHGTAAPAGAVAARALSEEGDDPRGAKLAERSGPVVRIFKKTTWAIKVNRAELAMGYGKFYSQFSRISNFKPKLNWGQTMINSNKLFE